MNNFILEKIINEKLNSYKFDDYLPNGLQIEGCENINKIITGVTACQKLLDNAVLQKAQAIIVHHGYFWKNEPLIIHGIKKNRIKTILSNNINLYCWHLPLDVHPEIGNNIQLSKKLNIDVLGSLSPFVLWGKFKKYMTINELKDLITKKIGKIPFCCFENTDTQIRTVAWCTGKGQSYINNAASFKVDAYITGEVSEETVHYARESGIIFFAIGHHNSEKFGIQELNNWLKSQYNLDCSFINIDNPV